MLQTVPLNADRRAALGKLFISDVQQTDPATLVQLRYRSGATLEPFSLHQRMGVTLMLSGLGYMSYSSSFLEGATVGRYCSVAANVRLMGDSHPTDWVTTHVFAYAPRYRRIIQDAGFADWDAVAPSKQPKPALTIGNDVWIGRDAVLARGITIGDGAIIASSAVVTKDVPPYAMVGGVPAKLIRYRFAPELCARLQHSQWWNYRIVDFGTSRMDRVEAFLDAFAARVDALTPLPQMRAMPEDLLQGPVPDGFGSAWI